MRMKEEWIREFTETFNEKRDYVECHHIAREMLKNRDETQLAKCLASLSALQEQADKKRWGGYKKLREKFLEQLDSLEEFPFNKEELKKQIEKLNECILNEKMTSLPTIYLIKND